MSENAQNHHIVIGKYFNATEIYMPLRKDFSICTFINLKLKVNFGLTRIEF